MILYGLFGKKNPTEKEIIKQLNKIKECYSQSEHRKLAMEKLLKWNTKSSIKAVLKRFEVVAESLYWDENEKTWLLKKLIKQGEDVKKSLISFIEISNDVTYAISALREICKNTLEFTEILIEILDKRPPEDYRFIQGKKEIIISLEETNSKKSLKYLIPYLDDHSDDIQCTIIDIIYKRKKTQTYKSLIDVIYKKNKSSRVLCYAANIIYKLKIKINNLPHELTKNYLIKKKYLCLKSNAQNL